MSNIRVYRYGLRPPTNETATEVRTQLRLAHHYRNTLVEIERARRDVERQILEAHGNVGAALQTARDAVARVEDAYASIGAWKSATNSAQVPEALRAAAADAKRIKWGALGAFRAALKQTRAAPDVAAQLALLDERDARLRRDARALCNVFWGTYLLVEADAHASRAELPLYDGVAPNGPRFVPWEGEGRVGVQTQTSTQAAKRIKALRAMLAEGGDTVALLAAIEAEKGLSVERALAGADTRVRITQAPRIGGHADPASKRSATRVFCALSLRVGSDGRAPRWAQWPMLMHRPLPPGARIKWVVVQCRRIGPREEWSVLFSVDLAGAASRLSSGDNLVAAPTGRVAIDIGWRIVPGGLRVAAWHDDAGQSGTLVLSQYDIGGFRKANELEALRKDNFNRARRELLIHGLIGLALPQWLADATRTLALWKSAAKLAALARRWRTARFEGDADAYDALEAWRYHDEHLWAWECSQRTKARRARREVYRLFAVGLARKYASVVFEDFNLRDVALSTPLEEPAGNETARGMRVIAATSILRGVVVNAFRSRGGAVEKVDPAYTTRACAACGSVERWDQAAELRHRCEGCGKEWDQDDNAAVNLLARRERSGSTPNPGGARNDGNVNDSASVVESRWARVRRMAAEKKRQKRTARKCASEVVE